MTLRNLDTRIGRLEANAPADRGELIDLSTLTPEQLLLLGSIPRFPDGRIDYDAMSEEALRLLASLG